jgi:hypothetical protein
LHLGIFEHPGENHFFMSLQGDVWPPGLDRGLSLLKWQVTAGYDPFPLPPAKSSLKPFKFKEQTTLTA